MKKILFIVFCFVSFSVLGQNGKDYYGTYVWWDTTYFKKVPYNSGGGVVHLGIDTVAGSPTFGKLVRKTAGGATPGIDDVLAVGQALTTGRNISVGANTLNVLGTSGGLYVSSASGNAVYAESSTIAGAGISTAPSSVNTIVPILDLYRQTTGTANNYIGGSISFWLSTSSSIRNSNRFISRWTVVDDATRESMALITGVSNAVEDTIIYFEGNKRTRFNGRAQFQQGADVASAAGAIAVGFDGNIFEITGTNAITLISSVGWQNGSEVTLIFTSTASLTDGTANSGTDIGMELAGNANFTGSADDTITLILTEIGGTQRWREKCRSVN